MTDISAFQPEVWTSSSNEALKIFVTDPEGAINIQPEFTYPIFGDSESIYGYKNLVIFLCFDHYTFKPFLNIKYDSKLPDNDIIDLKSTLLKYLPESTTFKDEIKWVDATKEEKSSYKIPGTEISTFTQDNQSYSIYKIDLKSASGLELHLRLQILVLLYIEAGSYIDSTDDLWDLYVLYEHTHENEPSIVGYSTVYNFWKYSGSKKFDLDLQESRKKISQFIILPNFQGKSLGGKFYCELYSLWLNDDKIKEVVVEDPNEKFDDMRDRCDLILLNENVNFNDIDILDFKNKQELEGIRVKLKLELRQFSRLLEMILLYKYKNQKKGSLKNIRLFIKKRLYYKNREGLEALDEDNRKDKLQTAYESLESDYYRILLPVKLKIAKEEHPAKRVKV